LKIGEQITVEGFRAKSEPMTAAARMIELPGGKKMSTADDHDGRRRFCLLKGIRSASGSVKYP
jgi:hypothetical protein